MRKYILILLTAFTIGSCEDDLSLEPFQSIEDEIALSTSESVEFVLRGGYDRLADTDALGGDMLLYSDLLGSDGVLSFFGTFDFLQDMSRKEMLFNNSGANITWITGYEVINQANIVLGAQDILDAGVRDRVVGEALFLRAISHFNLALLYSKPYSAGASNPGVILIRQEGAGDLECRPRSSLQDTFAAIIQDLEDAIALLPVTNDVFANRVAAYGILSRVYLQMEDYSNALDAANQAITLGTSYSLNTNYADAFGVSGNTSEDVFAIQVAQGDGTNGMNTFYAPASQGGRGDVRLDASFIATFAAGDDRANMIDSNGFIMKWFEQFGNVNVLRLAELHLTRAECNMRLSSSTGDTPLNDYNAVHERAGLTAAMTITLQDILDERVFELFGEGQYFYDQLRLKNPIGTFSFDADQLVLPIPTSQTIPCPDVEQNPGYLN